MKKELTAASLMEAGAHYGYSRTRRHPTVTPYIFGNKDGVDIIDVEKTICLTEEAKTYLADLSKNGKTVLFVGTKPEARAVIEATAAALHQPFVTERWIGGMLTNFSEIKRRIQKLETMKEERASGALEKYTKKEQLLINRELNRLQKYFSGVIGLTKMPEAIFVVDPKKEHIAIKEAHKLGITVIALGNTDCSIRGIQYPIIANDGSRSSISLILGILEDTYKQ